MKAIKIVIAKTQAGLHVAKGDFDIIETSKRRLDRCGSSYDAHFLSMIGAVGSIDIGEEGWIALAEKET